MNKPTNYKELKQFYVHIIKHISGVEIITTKRTTTKIRETIRDYTLNHEYIGECIELSQVNKDNDMIIQFLPHVLEHFKHIMGPKAPEKS